MSKKNQKETKETVEKVEAPAAAAKETAKKEKAPRAPKNPLVIVEVVVEAEGFEKPYHAEGQRANTMKATRAWIRERGLTVRLAGVTKDEVKNAKPETDKITYTFTAECLEANDVTPKAPQPRAKKEKPETPKEKVEVTVDETPAANEAAAAVAAPADEKPEEQEGAPSDW